MIMANAIPEELFSYDSGVLYVRLYLGMNWVLLHKTGCYRSKTRHIFICVEDLKAEDPELSSGTI